MNMKKIFIATPKFNSIEFKKAKNEITDIIKNGKVRIS